ncbi:PAS domain S-box protein [Oleidesulfovibrio sp.]|uniref:PAS domain S-box protein n=1 Tax=Oleidesulfovibrio sp. TaxID=2909707 RepID=UPI003A87EBE4
MVHRPRFRISLALRIVITTGLTLLAGLVALSWVNLRYHNQYAMTEFAKGADRLSSTILLGTRYAMMTNARHELDQIIRDLARQPDIHSIRIYNKEGAIMFSGLPEEIGQVTNIRDEACNVCHRIEPPKTELALDERTRQFTSAEGEPLLGSLRPIKNEPGCSGGPCHFHPAEKQVLGAMDVVMRLGPAQHDFTNFQKGMLGATAFVFLLAASVIVLLLRRFITQPVYRLTENTRRIGRGEPVLVTDTDQQDEIGELATAVRAMAEEIRQKQDELRRQRKEYQTLFEQVPCSITVQDSDFRLLQFNREFAGRFHPLPGAYCYQAYKGRTAPCPNCPVERTFKTGRSHCSEEYRTNTDGTQTHWLVHTSPITDDDGNVTAAMEMSIDVTALKKAEDRLRRSEQKYHAIFNNIPNSVFVLDAETLNIVDCNETAVAAYGYSHLDLKDKSFLDIFLPEERRRYASQLRAFTVLTRARNVRKDGSEFYVDIMLSPAEYHERKVLLVAANDVTERLETEQKLIQAGKMATLGEMATGVAHELNQPLTVIKTASSFIMRKVTRQENIAPDVLSTMAREIDTHVDRASSIINHMRDFGRQSDLTLEQVDLNAVLKASSEFFARQLTLRQIEVNWHLTEPLPPVMAVPNRLEQVFTNMLLNARDAIEEHCERHPESSRVITITTAVEECEVIARVCDTGKGIPQSLLNKIFEPFFTTKSVGKGTGLGLSISYGLVKGFGGNIQAENAEGGGACFTLRFPSAGSGAGTEKEDESA